jgi:acetylornithine deacetylase/succinyl-diaminopimelate desuccinylase-like protein
MEGMSDLTGQTVELLQTLIRNRCVNDGSATSGFETRNADTLRAFLLGDGGHGFDVQHFEPTPGRGSLVARIAGTDPDAPSLCLMGHTDVVPVNESGWSRDPFGGEVVDDANGVPEVWGRGAVDMLNLTASMAVAFRHLAATGFRPKGDLIYFAVADEESGSAHGAQWMADHERDAIWADYVLTENGGLHAGDPEAPAITVHVGETGVAWRRLRLHGTPGHGSVPYRSDNALVKAAAVVQRLAEYTPAPRFNELWTERVRTLGVDEETQRLLLDPAAVDDVIAQIPARGVAAYLHSCTHTTFSCNVVDGSFKTNVIPDAVELQVDIRTVPGDTPEDVEGHLRAALGDLYGEVEVEPMMNDMATISPTATPLWDAVARAVARPFPTSHLTPELVVGFTDSRVYRAMGSVAYGAGLFSPALDRGEYGLRFHGNDERIDVESLALTTQLWLDVVKELWR